MLPLIQTIISFCQPLIQTIERKGKDGREWVGSVNPDLSIQVSGLNWLKTRGGSKMGRVGSHISGLFRFSDPTRGEGEGENQGFGFWGFLTCAELILKLSHSL